MNSNSEDFKTKDTTKLLTFFINKQLLGVEISFVHQIIKTPAITSLPQTPEYFFGVMNLRGKVIPVLDLYLRLSGNQPIFQEYQCVIVIQMTYKTSNLLTGLCVDQVRDVIELKKSEISENSCQSIYNTNFIRSVGRSVDDLVLIIDVEKTIIDESIFNFK